MERFLSEDECLPRFECSDNYPRDVSTFHRSPNRDNADQREELRSFFLSYRCAILQINSLQKMTTLDDEPHCHSGEEDSQLH